MIFNLDFIAQVHKTTMGLKNILSYIFLIAFYTYIFIDLEIDIKELLTNSSKYIVDVVSRRMLPPDFSNFGKLIYSMFETIEIAMLGTPFAIILSIPMALLSAKNISPGYIIYFTSRVVTILFRALPEFIVAMILVIAVGFGAIPGILALGFHTMGFLAKFYAEAIEHINPNFSDALVSMGA